MSMTIKLKILKRALVYERFRVGLRNDALSTESRAGNGAAVFI